MDYKLLYALKSGKNIKLVYYIKNMLGMLIPNVFFQMQLHHKLASLSDRKDKDYILYRVNYYNKLLPGAILPESVPALAEHKLKGHKVYIYDTRCYTRWFSQQLRLNLCAGDVDFVPPIPSISKSRLITENNGNGVIMKLNKIRHFIFVRDKKKFTEKKDMAVFRGKVNRQRAANQIHENVFWPSHVRFGRYQPGYYQSYVVHWKIDH